jgi:hypothetical protein
MNELEENRQFLLEQLEIEANSYELYYSDDNGKTKNIIRQENDTNPKIEKLSIRAINAYIGIYEKTPNYAATIVKSEQLKEIIRATHKYYLKFSEDSEMQKFVCVDIEESKQQDLYWVLLLAKV